MYKVYGDNINTDVIIPGKYTKSLNDEDLANHAMEDLDENFVKDFVPGSFIVAGINFGCGSSREQAPLVLKLCGVSAVIAKSFAYTFYRNAINIGLTAVEYNDGVLDKYDEIDICFEESFIYNRTKNQEIQCSRLPKIMIDILDSGGLARYLYTHKKYSIY